MIHLTVAAPMGIDSVFFSFIERLALQNGHVCVDPPAEHLDVSEPMSWIEQMKISHQHHFVIGYRYSPPYWKMLAEHSSTVCLVADPIGVTRQVQRIQERESKLDHNHRLEASIEFIRYALSHTIDLAEWILGAGSRNDKMIIPAQSFSRYPELSFQRVEMFYAQHGLCAKQSCFAQFAHEASSLLQDERSQSTTIRDKILCSLSSDLVTPMKVQALELLFPM